MSKANKRSLISRLLRRPAPVMVNITVTVDSAWTARLDELVAELDHHIANPKVRMVS